MHANFRTASSYDPDHNMAAPSPEIQDSAAFYFTLGYLLCCLVLILQVSACSGELLQYIMYYPHA